MAETRRLVVPTACAGDCGASVNYFTSPKYERIEKMFLYRQLDMPLRLIGEKFGVSGCRVSQLLEQREKMARHYVEQQKQEDIDLLEVFISKQYNPRTHAAKAAWSLTDIC